MRYFVSLLLTLLLPEILWAAIVCGTATTSLTEADPQTVSVTPDAGSNRVMLGFIVVRGDGTTIDGATFNAVSLTSAGNANQTTGADMTLSIRGTPVTTEGAQDFTVDFGGTVLNSTLAMVTCTGVHATFFRGAATTNLFNGATSSTMDVPSAVNDLVVDFIGTSGSGDDPAPHASQASLFETSQAADNLWADASTEAGIAGNVTMSWTFTGSTGAQIGASLVPASVGLKRKPITFQ